MELDFAKLDQELIRQGMKCETVDALKTLAQAHQIELNDETAEKLLAKIKEISEKLSENILEEISGGRLWYKSAHETDLTIDDPDTMLIKWDKTEKNSSKY